MLGMRDDRQSRQNYIVKACSDRPTVKRSASGVSFRVIGDHHICHGSYGTLMNSYCSIGLHSIVVLFPCLMK